MTNLNTTKHFSACADHHMIADRGMPLTPLSSSTAKRHSLINQYVTTNFGGLTDDNSHTMVDKKTGTDLRPRMDFNAGNPSNDLRDETRDKRDPQRGMEKMADPMP